MVCNASDAMLLLQPTIYQTGCCHWHTVGGKKGKIKRKGKEKTQDKGSFLKNHETGIVIMTF